MRPKTKGPRLSATLTQAQTKLLQQESERLGISLGELVRRILDRWFEGKEIGS
jgi:hypothetical protein